MTLVSLVMLGAGGVAVINGVGGFFIERYMRKRGTYPAKPTPPAIRIAIRVAFIVLGVALLAGAFQTTN